MGWGAVTWLTGPERDEMLKRALPELRPAEDAEETIAV